MRDIGPPRTPLGHAVFVAAFERAYVAAKREVELGRRPRSRRVSFPLTVEVPRRALADGELELYATLFVAAGIQAATAEARRGDARLEAANSAHEDTLRWRVVDVAHATSVSRASS